MSYETSIYKALGLVAGVDSKKRGIAYLYAIANSRHNRIISKDPIIGEAQNVYVGLDAMGRTTLHNDSGEKYLINFIQEEFDKNNYSPQQGTVEEVVLKLFHKKGISETIDIVGDSLTKLMKSSDFKKPIDEISPGRFNREEQKLIRKEISSYLD